MLKLSALLFLTLACTLGGFFYGGEQKKKACIFAELVRFFQHLHFEIETFSKDQNTIFKRFDSPVLQEIGFLEALTKESETHPFGALHRSLQNFETELFLSQKVTEEIYPYSENFGIRSQGMELMMLKKLILWLEKENEAVQKTTENLVRLSRTLGFCIGAGLMILFL